jgi:uncharacterized protein YpmB
MGIFIIILALVVIVIGLKMNIFEKFLKKSVSPKNTEGAKIDPLKENTDAGTIDKINNKKTPDVSSSENIPIIQPLKMVKITEKIKELRK